MNDFFIYITFHFELSIATKQICGTCLHVCWVNVSSCLCICIFLVCHPASVLVRFLQAAEVVCHYEPGSDRPDGPAETADNFYGDSAHDGYQRFRSEPNVSHTV